MAGNAVIDVRLIRKAKGRTVMYFYGLILIVNSKPMLKYQMQGKPILSAN
jgi:hypothetical protein